MRLEISSFAGIVLFLILSKAVISFNKPANIGGNENRCWHWDQVLFNPWYPQFTKGDRYIFKEILSQKAFKTHRCVFFLRNQLNNKQYQTVVRHNFWGSSFWSLTVCSQRCFCYTHHCNTHQQLSLPTAGQLFREEGREAETEAKELRERKQGKKHLVQTKE